MKYLIRTMLAVCAICAAVDAPATDLFRAVLMPDAGFGGAKINEAFRNHLGGSRILVGSVANAQGKPTPYVWDLDNDGNVLDTQALPIAPGWQGAAVGGCMFPNGDIVIVGRIENGDIPDSQIWKKPLFGPWQTRSLTNLPVEISDTLNWYEDDQGHGTHLYGVGGVVIGGLRRPCFFDIFPNISNGDISMQFRLLPYIEQNASATAIGRNSNGVMAVSGWGTLPNGRRKPCVWEGPSLDTFRMIRLPANVQGEALGVSLFDSGAAIAGALMRNGRIRGFCETTSTAFPEGQISLFDPLDGFGGSTVDTTLNMGDFATHEVGHWMGTSFNGLNRVATLWVSNNSGGIWRTDASSVWTNNPGQGITAFQAMPELDANGNWIAFGQVHNDGEIYAAAFLPTGEIVPGSVDVPVGNIMSTLSNLNAIRGQAYPPDCWHEDGAELQVLTEKIGNGYVATADVAMEELGFMDTNFMASNLRVNARAASNQPGASGTLKFRMFNVQTQSFDTVGTVNLTDASQRFDIAFNPAKYWDPAFRRVRASLEFVQNGNKRAALCLDYCGVR